MSKQTTTETLDAKDVQNVTGGNGKWQLEPVTELPVYLTQAIGEDGGDLPDLMLS